MSERIGFFLLGCFGIFTVIPNIMIGDSGGKKSTKIANICLIGSGCIIVSGICGILHNRYLPLIYPKRLGIIGLSLQIGGLCLLGI